MAWQRQSGADRIGSAARSTATVYAAEQVPRYHRPTLATYLPAISSLLTGVYTLLFGSDTTVSVQSLTLLSESSSNASNESTTENYDLRGL